MKNLLKAVPYLAFLLMTACSSKDIVVEDFESGTFDKWSVEGDAFGAIPTTGAYPGQQEVKGFEGKYLANSYNGGDDSRGTITSSEFTIERNFINFLLGGGMHSDTFIELLIGGSSVYVSRPIVESETLEWATWDVQAYKGQKAVVRIVDNQEGPWGHILVDQIEMSNREKSNFWQNHKLTFDINKKYLLVPIEERVAESHLYLEVDGNTVGPQLNIRLAQTKVDYWMPINVEQYKGKQLSLVFAYVTKGDIGYSQIKQSDDYHFDYNEQYRPYYHFSPQYGWTNDPNGMVYHNGEYHLFYQHNPYGSMWGNMNWGHAVSKDLKKWEHLPVAISPDSIGAIFSGSAVIDKENTAGFGKNAMVAIYTAAGKSQVQSIAYSLDNGRTFTKYNRNPVLTDPNYVDFRDPKVFWHDASKQWIMSLATTQVITFYGSKDLKEWNKLSEFGEGIGNHKGVWECPDLFPMVYNGQTKWVLLVSINPGGPNGGSATQYFIGDFDGKTFKADALPYPLWLDSGRDNYAGVTWSGAPDNRRVFIGWMSNWDYTELVPSVNFRGAMTLPRELKLVNNGKHLVVANPPVREIDELRSKAKDYQDLTIDKAYTIEKLLDNNNGAYEIEMLINRNNSENFSLVLSNRKGEELSFIFDLKNENLIVDRAKSGIIDFSEKFVTGAINGLIVKKPSYKIRLFIDKASSELFVNDGEVVQTNTMFPSEPYNILTFKTENGAIDVKGLKIYTLN